MKQKQTTCTTIALTVLAFAAAPVARGAVYRIDFQPSGAHFTNFDGNTEAQATASNPAFGSDGTNQWNEIGIPYEPLGNGSQAVNYTNTPTAFPLVTSTNAASTANLNFIGGIVYYANWNAGGNALTNDFIAWGSYTGAPTLTWSFTGLDPNAPFALTLYSDGQGGNRQVDFQIDTDGNGTLDTSLPGNSGAGFDYRYITGVTSATGSILGTGTAVDGFWGGMQLSVTGVPEPGTALLGLAGLAATTLRRRRR